MTYCTAVTCGCPGVCWWSARVFDEYGNVEGVLPDGVRPERRHTFKSPTCCVQDDSIGALARGLRSHLGTKPAPARRDALSCAVLGIFERLSGCPLVTPSWEVDLWYYRTPVEVLVGSRLYQTGV